MSQGPERPIQRIEYRLVDGGHDPQSHICLCEPSSPSNTLCVGYALCGASVCGAITDIREAFDGLGDLAVWVCAACTRQWRDMVAGSGATHDAEIDYE